MRKPIHGDLLTIRYNGAVLRASCGEVTETPKRGPGAANFTIVSKTIFQHGGEAFLLEGADETALRIERVTSMPHKHINIVSFAAVFESAEASV